MSMYQVEETAQHTRNVYGCAPGPLPHSGEAVRGHPKPLHCSQARNLSGLRGCPGWRSSLRPGFAVARAFCALRALPRRGPALRSVAPARRAAPRVSLRFPPLPRSACVRRCAAPWRSLGPAAFGPGFASLRAPCSVALAALALGPCAARSPAGVACAPSGARNALAPAPAPLAALWAAFPPPGAGAFPAARGRPRPLARFPAGAAVWGSFSPAAPRPAAPAGGSRGREARSGGFAPRCVGRASRAPLAGPPRASRVTRYRFFGSVDYPEIVNPGFPARRERHFSAASRLKPGALRAALTCRAPKKVPGGP